MVDVPLPPPKDQPWTADDWTNWAYHLGLKLDWHTRPFGMDNRERIEKAIEQFRAAHNTG